MRRLRIPRPAVVVLVLASGLLPVSARALPSNLPAAAHRLEAHLEAKPWLDHLATVLGSLWKRATAETGISIDPNGQPTATPTGPAPGADTGKSIDPDG